MIRIGAVSAHFGRDLEFSLQRITALIDRARRSGVSLLVLPDAALGGYQTDARQQEPDTLPPALPMDHPSVAKVVALAAEMVVCFGFCEADRNRRYNTAVCVCGDGILGTYRQVHRSAAETTYSSGSSFAAFDTPAGRLGMMIDYDKTFPEAARTLAMDGAEVLACLSAWPTSITNRAPRMSHDRQSRLFDLYDQARAAENQVVVASSNQTGSRGGLRFLGQAKVVGPSGDILARTWSKAGIAVAQIDLRAEIANARSGFTHLDERKPDAYLA